MNEQAQALARQLRQAIERSHEGYPLQITFEPFQLTLLAEILDDAEARENESEIWRRVEALAKRVLAEPRPGPPRAQIHEVNGHFFIDAPGVDFPYTNCDRCGEQFGARYTRGCQPNQGSKP